MSQYISDIVEEDTIECLVCNQVFDTDKITLEDYNFAWDGYVHTDCCSKCSHKVLAKEERLC